MIVERLELSGFRNIESAHLSFSGTFNYITGRNAQGKTNLLEAIHLFSLGRSFRTRRASEMVGFGSGRFFLRLSGRSDSGVGFRIEAGLERGGRVRAAVNGTALGGMGELVGLLPSVLFTPADSELAAGPPAARRLYLDYTAALISPEFLDRYRQYRSALRQRNALLREAAAGGRLDERQLDAWDLVMAQSGAAVIRGRIETLGILEARARDICSTVIGGDGLELVYTPSFGPRPEEAETTILETLASTRETEARRGYTLSGPHCDDMAIRAGGVDLRRYGSQGRLRLTAIALRLAQAAVILERRGERPIVLLDDLFSELDAQVADGVRAVLSDRYQSFITSPRPEDVPAGRGGGSWLTVKAGVFSGTAGEPGCAGG
ncbi:MAG: DNA replication/repair protein RecF [Candidatus Krumholzibacteria bacterium]|nr:DNA replication/repair protein RecF [Candidatus Krumholzibacteria bacterium]